MKKIALVLGGGAARGFAHLGVIDVLQENNIKFDCIVGCSIGSLLGALVAVGHQPRGILKLAKALGREPWLEFVIPKMGLFGTKRIHAGIALLTKNKRIEELDVEFATVGTSLHTGKEYVFQQGRLADAVCGSICVPGVFEPFVYEDMLLGDGAILNPTPVNVAKQMGADIIIAVDLSHARIVGNVNNIYDVIIRSLSLLEQNSMSYNDVYKYSDVLLQPVFSMSGVESMTNFQHIEEFYQIGRETALAKLDEIKAKIVD